jgi:hypothetical protein
MGISLPMNTNNRMNPQVRFYRCKWWAQRQLELDASGALQQFFQVSNEKELFVGLKI